MTISLRMIRLAINGLWLAWVVFWAIGARGNKPDQRRESVASRVSHMLPLGIAFALLAMPAPARWLGAPLLPPSLAQAWFGTALLAAGLVFSCWARVHIGRNWSGTVTVKQGHALVQSGPYAIVRHPIYTGLLLACIGTAVARDDVRGVLAVALAVFALVRKLRLEERWMTEQFPREYPGYRGRVPALIPFLA
jgi:protein-S-isoprenylcysteine O-methyltransferase Ste14